MERLAARLAIGNGAGRNVPIRRLALELDASPWRMSRVFNGHENPATSRGRWRTIEEFEREVERAVAVIRQRREQEVSANGHAAG